MTYRIIVAAILALTASAGAAHAEIAPSYNAYGECAVYALSVDPSFCADQVDAAAAAIAVDPVVTGGVDVAPTSDILPKDGKYSVSPNAGGRTPARSSGHADGLLVHAIAP